MNPPDSSPNVEGYQVVARKYRPQSFESLIGQGHIATALANAIRQSRIGHAYLFTGARGVGKTSSARIFAKCLNCVTGPTTTPCNECDVCSAISVGEDVDVLEIDGASNRGIDEIRSLRSNAAIRPSRAKFKIYIIDEVHMLTSQAFNALLKTLEEPPKHVKFIFCTTDPHKMPITVLSRCQRFDFSPVQTDSIAESLKTIVAQENKTADEDALMLLARRANGSMRDSQSLLEQVFSFSGNHLSVEAIHQLLGTAGIGRIAELATALLGHDSTKSLSLIHEALSQGVDAGQLASQLLGYFRDVMTVKIGCSPDTLLMCSPADVETIRTQIDDVGLETLLSMIQILDSGLVRMQSSLHARTLLEVAAIRICNLQNLDAISELVKQISDSGSASPAARPRISPPHAAPQPTVEQKTAPAEPSTKKKEVVDSTSHFTSQSPCHSPSPTSSLSAPNHSLPAAPTATKDTESAGTHFTETHRDAPHPSVLKTHRDSDVEIEREPVAVLAVPAKPSTNASGSRNQLSQDWQAMAESMVGMTAEMVASPEALVLVEPNLIRATLKDAYTVRECLKPERKQSIESALSAITGRSVRVEFCVSETARQAAENVAPRLSQAQLKRMLLEQDFVKKAMDVFDAEITQFYQRAKN